MKPGSSCAMAEGTKSSGMVFSVLNTNRFPMVAPLFWASISLSVSFVVFVQYVCERKVECNHGAKTIAQQKQDEDLHQQGVEPNFQ